MGAKPYASKVFHSIRVSIHAPVMGANISVVEAKTSAGFNPRTRDGCEFAFKKKSANDPVSIHAPVMGAKRG